MWVLLGPGDTALVPTPSYPIHIYAPLFAGADVRHVPLGSTGEDDGGEAFFHNIKEAWDNAWPKPRVIILSFPHNPTTTSGTFASMYRPQSLSPEHEVTPA